MSKPDWSQINPSHNWIAQDADGEWWSYTHQPSAGKRVWWMPEVYHAAIFLEEGGTAGNPNWRDTLEERPK